VVVVEEVDGMPTCSEACPSIKGLKMINW
jgi:hypothetical protein